MRQPLSPSCTVAGGGGGGGGGGEDPFDGIVFPREFLRWLLDDDDGCFYRATMGADASSRFRACAAAPTSSSHSSMLQPSSHSCAVAGGAAGRGEDPYQGITIPPEYLRWLLDDDDGCLYQATAATEAEASPPSSYSPMPQRQPSSLLCCTAAGGGSGGGEEDPFDDDIVIPPDLLQGLNDDNDDGSLHGEAAMGADAEAEDERRVADAQAGGEGGHVEDAGLSMTYRGHTRVFDSVPPHKVETILMLLNDYEHAPHSVKPKPTNLVPPIVVPQDFDRAVAMSRYWKKRKSTMRADYSIRREIALRIARRGGKFVPSKKSSENLVGIAEAAELQFCANCGESSEVTPQMRHGPTGAKNFCNACGLMWATSRKIRNVTNAESRHGGSQH